MTNQFPNAGHFCNTLADIFNIRLEIDQRKDELEELNNEFPFIAPTGRIQFSQLQQYNQALDDIKKKEGQIEHLTRTLSLKEAAVKNFIPKDLREREFSASDDRGQYIYFYDSNDDLVIKYNPFTSR